ncbi:MAG TPA: potassium transporter TrkG [Phycisphaerae bacterium]|nr:potassium transporter TrkG [Phycisphaerae bacterium]
MAREKHHRLFISAMTRPEGFLVATFAGLILLGAILLSLPAAHARGPIHPLDALFTSTSAVCVTGLVVVDTAGDYTRFGQVVILALIQCGGLGIMTFAALAMQAVGRRLSFRAQVALHDVFYQKNAAQEFRHSLRWIVLLTLAIEGAGALVLANALHDSLGWREALYAGTFHSISAFCNAGFSTFSDNLMAVRSNPVFLSTVALLIVLGGLGYTVLLETLWRLRRPLGQRKHTAWSLNTRVVLRTTIVLIFVGAVLLLVTGLDGGSGDSWISGAGHALFQSVSARTAGFNTINIGACPVASLVLLVLLMFIGGSPGSCAGGVKTTSIAVWIARLRARLGQQEDVTLAGRRVSVDLIRRTGLLIAVAAMFNLIGVLILSATEAARPSWHLEHLLFEQISAFATVGLSTGITPELTAAGKLWIILTMFVGRLGPLTIAMIVTEHKPPMVRLPEERIMVG